MSSLRQTYDFRDPMRNPTQIEREICQRRCVVVVVVEKGAGGEKISIVDHTCQMSRL